MSKKQELVTRQDEAEEKASERFPTFEEDMALKVASAIRGLITNDLTMMQVRAILGNWWLSVPTDMRKAKRQATLLQFERLKQAAEGMYQEFQTLSIGDR